MNAMKNWSRRTLLRGSALALAGTTTLAAAGKPKSIIHVVTLYWKDGTTAAQKKAVFDGIEKMGAAMPGIKNIWLKSINVQGDIDGKKLESAFVMEFESAAALKAYANHPAHKAWEKIYLPLRGESRTHDITNE